MMYLVDQIHHLINESKILIFVYNSDRREYIFIFNYPNDIYLTILSLILGEIIFCPTLLT